MNGGNGEGSLRCPTCKRPVAFEVLEDLWDPMNPEDLPDEVPMDNEFAEMVQEQQEAANED